MVRLAGFQMTFRAAFLGWRPVLIDRGIGVLDPELVGNPVVERVLGERGDRHIAPAWQQVVLNPVGEGAEVMPFATDPCIFLARPLAQLGDRRLGIAVERVLGHRGGRDWLRLLWLIGPQHSGDPCAVGGQGVLVTCEFNGFVPVAGAEIDRLAGLPVAIDLEGGAPDIVGPAAAKLVQPDGVAELG